mmetsp:Transcript_31213/g.78048  ORF Transcript_31213/g.78048 Transcript_31213/m.78048 type:complete len:224 (-) Transcript_31213:28-699(-)
MPEPRARGAACSLQQQLFEVRERRLLRPLNVHIHCLPLGLRLLPHIRSTDTTATAAHALCAPLLFAIGVSGRAGVAVCRFRGRGKSHRTVRVEQGAAHHRPAARGVPAERGCHRHRRRLVLCLASAHSIRRPASARAERRDERRRRSETPRGRPKAGDARAGSGARRGWAERATLDREQRMPPVWLGRGGQWQRGGLRAPRPLPARVLRLRLLARPTGLTGPP